MGWEREKKPRTMSGFLGSFKPKRLPFPGTILRAERACPRGGGSGWGAGGEETKDPASAGQVSAGYQTFYGIFYFLIIRLLLLKMMLRFNRSDIILGDNVEQSLLTKLLPFKK